MRVPKRSDASPVAVRARGTSTRSPGLDVLRGLAVLAVLLRHAFPEVFGGAGIVGVELFFVLSGFLITGSIEQEIRRRGIFSFKRFYRNRALRLLPAFALLLLCWSAIVLVADPWGDRALLPRTLAVSGLYLTDLAGDMPLGQGVSHLWTLAVEEQFYLLWPLLLVAALRRGRTGPLVALATTGALGASVATVVVFRHDPGAGYAFPSSWFVTLVVGAAAYLGRRRLVALVGGLTGRALTAAAGGVLAAFCFLPEAKESAVTYLVATPSLAIASVVLILSAARWSPRVLRVLVPFRALGIVSYGVYLWNYLVVSLLRGADELTAGEALLSVPLTLAAALVSWYLVERPALRLKARLDARARSLPDGPVPQRSRIEVPAPDAADPARSPALSRR